MASCHSKFAVYEVINCRTIVRVHLETYIENINIYMYIFIWLPVISCLGHFVPTLVISYLLFGHLVPSNNHFVPRSFRTHFGHFVPRSTGYEMTIWWSIRTQDVSYPFWSFRTQQRWMHGEACLNRNHKLTSYSSLLHNEILCHF